ncbi:MotA/TolQ/ExbB proton channel family protein [Azohydromonas caseinilytica]|uniref:MotA/TolQ/ExbB proton channel family protein n=1 Tax=Azohydromonas caseinilytica TaxID=2728836 RepID=A0A848F9F3_9BURK|nr:MotA/TolQ/ExbB proton channel family protein [Azohydromonas caseinilytica]NML15466.1 MotA/TolQ/ExbB proton channel family protein [Azohydromonas caseinilytica]
MFSIIQAAGWPIWPLLLCSVLALTLIIERLLSLRAGRITPPKLLDEVLQLTHAALPGPDVVQKLEQHSVMGQVLAAGMLSVLREPRIDEGRLRQAFQNAGRVAVHELERYLSALGSIASAAPLLGLFGTVVGMIELFGAQTPGGGTNPQQIAHGISVALYNTAFGLAIAIPALLFYRHFRARVDEYTLVLEQAAERLLPLLLRQAAARGA